MHETDGSINKAGSSAAASGTVRLTDEEFLHTAESIVRHEWEQFQRVDNKGGRALCQGNWPVFHQMRISQFLTWDAPLLLSYAQDLNDADAAGRNLLTEKYARMMGSTDPVYYHQHLETFMPVLSRQRIAQQEHIIAQQLTWARDFKDRYPRLGQKMRTLTTDGDSPENTSFETYLRGELGTYSGRTLDLYGIFIESCIKKGINLTEQAIGWTVRIAGLPNLADAENAES